ncbi:type III-A CRISPR-associated RAMP protein Csm5 [Halocatena marina]|uniref:type III-A CRISPR-associated RAMP protein Csm5 n=1 Tax=Halocatena marina TaxID=2934937 RepID=UPI0022259460|nr:type III-A CRISPR-associated RAMP protein Csm5 [Halocatena marina]
MKIDLKVRSPTHIGSGDELSRHEYQFEDGQAFVPDIRTYFRDNPNEVDAFVTAIERSEPVNHIFDDGYSRYTLDSSWVNPDSIRGSVSVALKDGSDVPYIPGTSLKGWIRTTLAYRALENGASLHRVNKQAINDLFRVGKGETRDDLLRCVTVQDAHPVSEAELALCEIKTYSLDRSGTLRERGSDYAECLTRGTEFTTDVSVNKKLLEKLIDEHDGDATRVFGDDLTKRGILATISEASVDFQEAVIREDQRLFDHRSVRAIYSSLSNSGPLFRLGSGTGHHSKTVAMALPEADRIRANVGAANNKLKHAKCGGEVEHGRCGDRTLSCKRCDETGIQPDFDNVIRFPKTKRFVVYNGEPLHLLGWVKASFRGPL